MHKCTQVLTSAHKCTGLLLCILLIICTSPSWQKKSSHLWRPSDKNALSCSVFLKPNAFLKCFIYIPIHTCPISRWWRYTIRYELLYFCISKIFGFIYIPTVLSDDDDDMSYQIWSASWMQYASELDALLVFDCALPCSIF